MANKTTTINFKDYFNDEYEFLMAQHNRSLFICELIREYMNGGDIQSVRSSKMDEKPVKMEEQNNSGTTNLKDKPKKKSKNISGVI